MLAAMPADHPAFLVPVPEERNRAARPPREVAVLVVDDSEAFRYAIGRSLAHEGYRVLEASNGDEALDVLADNDDVQALVVDLVMPGLSGVELLRVLAQRKVRKPLHIVVCTGQLPVTQELREVLASVGVTSLLTKPCTLEQLLEAFKEDEP